MKSEILISIIVPVYNVSPYLHEALDSVINQTYKNLEIIVINDGSTDGSDKICDEYASRDNRIKVIHQENKGLSNARNVGLDIMKGEAVAFFDSDDILKPGYIEIMKNAMLQMKVDLVICKYTQFTKGGALLSNIMLYPLIDSGLYDRVQILQALADEKVNLHVWNKLYRRELFNNIQFPEGRSYQDIATIFKVFNLTKLTQVLSKPLYIHRNYKESISHTHSLKSMEDWNYARLQFEIFIEQNIPDIFTVEQLNSFHRRSDFYKQYIIKNII